MYICATSFADAHTRTHARTHARTYNYLFDSTSIIMYRSLQLVALPTSWQGEIVTRYRPLSRRLDHCDRVIQNESRDPFGGNVY